VLAFAVAALALGAPVLDPFDQPLDPLVWFVGVGNPPAKGVLRVPRGGWIVSRGIPDDGVERIEIAFRHKGGQLELTFHTAEEPLSSPQGDPIVVPRGKGDRLLEVTPEGARLDGEALPWKGRLFGTFRLAAGKGDVELDEVRVAPRGGGPVSFSTLERRTVLFATTPHVYRDGEAVYRRVTLLLWDADVAFLLRRGEDAGCVALAAPVKNAPSLAALVTVSDGRALAQKAGSNPLALRDWGDEQRNLSRGDYLLYLASEYARFELILQAQRAMNLALPPRKGLDALPHLAVVRHSASPHAAVALAETQGAREALAALRKALGKGADPARARPEALRAAAGRAAQAILGDQPPAEWPGFRYDPTSRSVTMDQAKELAR